MQKTLTICNGCGKEVEETAPHSWLMGTLTVIGTSQKEDFHLCSMECLIRFGQAKVNSQN